MDIQNTTGIGSSPMSSAVKRQVESESVEGPRQSKAAELAEQAKMEVPPRIPPLASQDIGRIIDMSV